MAKGANMGDGSKMPTVAVRFPKALFDKINDAAYRRNVSFAAIVRDAMDKAMK